MRMQKYSSSPNRQVHPLRWERSSISRCPSMTRAANFGKDAAICEMEHQQAAPLRLCKEEKRGMLSKASPFLIEQGKISQNQTLEKW